MLREMIEYTIAWLSENIQPKTYNYDLEEHKSHIESVCVHTGEYVGKYFRIAKGNLPSTGESVWAVQDIKYGIFIHYDISAGRNADGFRNTINYFIQKEKEYEDVDGSTS